MYSNVINTEYKKKYQEQHEDVKGYHKKLNELNEDINKARKKFLTDKVGQKGYYEFKSECESEIARIDAQLIKIASQRDKIDDLLKKAFANLTNLQQLFDNGDLSQKGRIIGSIFPEKLVFGGINYRTAHLNEAAQLIYNMDKAFSENKKGQDERNFDLSSSVPHIGVFSNHFLGDLKLLAEMTEEI
jgi:hypothetical protein